MRYQWLNLIIQLFSDSINVLQVTFLNRKTVRSREQANSFKTWNKEWYFLKLDWLNATRFNTFHFLYRFHYTLCCFTSLVIA